MYDIEALDIETADDMVAKLAEKEGLRLCVECEVLENKLFYHFDDGAYIEVFYDRAGKPKAKVHRT